MPGVRDDWQILVSAIRIGLAGAEERCGSARNWQILTHSQVAVFDPNSLLAAVSRNLKSVVTRLNASCF